MNLLRRPAEERRLLQVALPAIHIPGLPASAGHKKVRFCVGGPGLEADPQVLPGAQGIVIGKSQLSLPPVFRDSLWIRRFRGALPPELEIPDRTADARDDQQDQQQPQSQIVTTGQPRGCDRVRRLRGVSLAIGRNGHDSRLGEGALRVNRQLHGVPPPRPTGVWGHSNAGHTLAHTLALCHEFSTEPTSIAAK